MSDLRFLNEVTAGTPKRWHILRVYVKRPSYLMSDTNITVDNKSTRVYTAAAAAGTNNYNRFVYINVRPPLSSMSVCIGWATTGFTIRSLSRVFWVMGHMRRRCTDQPTYPSAHPVLQQYVVWYSSKAQYTAEKPTHQQPTNPPCVYYRLILKTDGNGFSGHDSDECCIDINSPHTTLSENWTSSWELIWL